MYIFYFLPGVPPYLLSFPWTCFVFVMLLQFLLFQSQENAFWSSVWSDVCGFSYPVLTPAATSVARQTVQRTGSLLSLSSSSISGSNTFFSFLSASALVSRSGTVRTVNHPYCEEFRDSTWDYDCAAEFTQMQTDAFIGWKLLVTLLLLRWEDVFVCLFSLVMIIELAQLYTRVQILRNTVEKESREAD